MGIKIGVSNGPLNRFCKDEKEGLKIIADCGFDCIDYHIIKYELRNPKREDSRAEREDYFLGLKDSLSSSKTVVHQTHAVFPTYVGKKSTDEILLDSLIKSVEAAGLLGAEYMVVHPAKIYLHRHGFMKPVRKRINLAMYRALLPALREYNVKAAIENMFARHKLTGKLIPTTCSYSKEMLDFLHELDDRHFCLCYDSGHANIIYKDGGVGMISELGEKISICHLHDNDGLHDLHNLPYNGTIDWDKLMQRLRSTGYNGVLNFECHYADGVGSLAEAVENLKKIYSAGRAFSKFWETNV